MADAPSTAAERAAGLSIWQGPVRPTPISGGTTNVNLKVEDAGSRYVVRVGEDLPVHQIMRFSERAAAKAAHAAGISPEVVHAEPGAMVFRYVEGRTLAPADLQSEAMLARVVPLVRAAHEAIPKHFRGPAPIFWVFQVLRDYAARLTDDGHRLAAELPRYMALAERLERIVGPIEIVFGHNDLLAANLIDDGSRLWLVDWEYAQWADPTWDVACLLDYYPELQPRRDAVLEACGLGSAADQQILSLQQALFARLNGLWKLAYVGLAG